MGEASGVVPGELRPGFLQEVGRWDALFAGGGLWPAWHLRGDPRDDHHEPETQSSP